jgi:hypothetical protein
MIVAFLLLLAGISATPAQDQERKLIDRLLKPNMSLVNSAQNKQFGAPDISITKSAPSRSFHTRDTFLVRPFVAEGAFSPGQFAARHFRARDTPANISTRSQLTKTNTVYVASGVYGTRVAPESDRSLTTTPFAGSRPFLGRGKSQKALSARDTPLTISQVRELLNKTK